MLIPLVLGLSVLALAVAGLLARYVLRQDNGTPEMRRISDAIQEGAEAFLRRQYRTIGTLSLVLGGLIYVLYAFFRKPHGDEPAAGILAVTTTASSRSVRFRMSTGWWDISMMPPALSVMGPKVSIARM